MERRLDLPDGLILGGLLIGYLITWGMMYHILDDSGALTDMGSSREVVPPVGLAVLGCLLIGAGWWVQGVGGERASVLGGVALTLAPFTAPGLVLGDPGALLLGVVLVSVALLVPSLIGVGLRQLAARYGVMPSAVGRVARGVMAFGGGLATVWLVAGALLLAGEHGLWLVAAPWLLARAHEVWLYDLIAVPLVAWGVVLGTRRALRLGASGPDSFSALVTAGVCAALTAGFSATGMMDTGLYYPIHVILWGTASLLACLFAHVRPGVDAPHPTSP